MKTTRGLFEEAEGGTLFLDELGEATHPFQLRLLRAIQERTIVRVGGTKPIPVEVRLLAATNKDLYEEVKSGKFREDLFYRVNVIRIDIPPLRDRRNDIPLLAERFIEKHCASMNKRKMTLTLEAAGVLMKHSWPGNVRELENVMERIVALHTTDTITKVDAAQYVNVFQREDEESQDTYPYKQARDLFEKRYMEAVLARASGDLNIASEYAGVHFTTLYRKMRKYGIVS